MTTEEALDLLRPFNPEIPVDALDCIRDNWPEAEAALIAELDEKLEHPEEEDQDALFLYALYLCAEMKSAEAFSRYLALCHLPTVLLDHVLGDILTEGMPGMLSRTCCGKIDELKKLIENSTLNEFARVAGLVALQEIWMDGELSRDDAMAYCIHLLDGGLEPLPSMAWDETITFTVALYPKEAMPLIERAYENDLADSSFQTLDEIQAALDQDPNEAEQNAFRLRRPLQSTETEIALYASNWEKEYNGTASPAELMDILNERQPIIPGSSPKTGRNDPCPCGSGKKYKKCCINAAPAPIADTTNETVSDENLPAYLWMKAGYLHLKKHNPHSAYTCWKFCWKDLKNIIPRTLLDPAMVESSGTFNGYEFLKAWIYDFALLLEDKSKYSLTMLKYGITFCEEILERFPNMESEYIQFIQATLEARLGKTENLLNLLKHSIEEKPTDAKGYAVLADLYSLDATNYHIEPDLERARTLLEAALDNAENCEEWDILSRLEDIQCRINPGR